MAFIWVKRTDDELSWTWDESDKAIHTDHFSRVYPNRSPRGGQTGRLGPRALAGSIWTITSGASWDLGDLLRLNDPDAEDFDLRELSGVGESAIAVAAVNVVSGNVAAGDLHDYISAYAPHWNVTAESRFHTTDVNGTVPATVHVGQQASLDNSSGWQLDLTGSNALEITAIDTGRARFEVKFLADFIQDNPGD